MFGIQNMWKFSTKMIAVCWNQSTFGVVKGCLPFSSSVISLYRAAGSKINYFVTKERSFPTVTFQLRLEWSTLSDI